MFMYAWKSLKVQYVMFKGVFRHVIIFKFKRQLGVKRCDLQFYPAVDLSSLASFIILGFCYVLK